MKNFIIIGTAILVAALLVGGIYFPDAPLMWFASTGAVYSVLRGITLAALVLLLVTNPPRSRNFRMILSGLAIFIGTFAVSAIETYSVGLIDAAVFSQVAILLGIEALEIGEVSTQKANEATKLSTQH